MKTKLYILTGFLGSGKTTLLLNILEKLQGHRVGVIQNESGKISVDGALLRNDDIQMVEITHGSIFCACQKSGFVTALCDMASRGFEYLFVESTGIGDPSNVGEILAMVSEDGGSLDFHGVICLVDAVNFAWQLSCREEAYRQVKHCHMAVITKTDLVPPWVLGETETAIRGINPVCPISSCVNGRLDMSFLREDLLRYAWAEDEQSVNTKDTKPKTIFMNILAPVERRELQDFLKGISPSVLRVKGFADVIGQGCCQIDLVGQVLGVRPVEYTEKPQLVFISDKGPAVIRDVFDAWKSKVSSPMELKN